MKTPGGQRVERWRARAAKSREKQRQWAKRLRREHPVAWALLYSATLSTLFVALAFGGGRGGQPPIFSSTKDVPWVWPLAFAVTYLAALGLAYFLNARERSSRRQR